MSEYTQQAEQFAEKYKVKLLIIGMSYGRYFQNDDRNRYIFRCVLKAGKKQYSFTFGQSIAAGSEEPKMYDVLAALTKYDPGSFEDFCCMYGYDTDSRKAEKLWQGVVKEWRSVERIFSEEALLELQNIV